MNVTETEIAEIQPDYIILDEFHRCGAELWGAGVDAVLKAYPNNPVLGLSATAIRYLDNQRDMTDELFGGNIASEMTLGESIVRNILSPPKYILSIFSYQQDLEKYEKRVRSAKSKAVQDAASAYLEALRRALDKAEKGYRELTDEQITRLDSLSMIWGNKLEMRWKNAFQALCKYHKEYGTFDVKCNFKTEDGINLGKWVRDQRDMFAKGKLSDERAEKLRGIGFELEKSDPWEEKYRLAKDYYEEHGDLNVPFDYVASGVWLNKWLNEQKQIAEGKRKKQLSSEQLTKLEEIGFRYGATLYEQQWNERYELAKAYYKEYGDRINKELMIRVRVTKEEHEKFTKKAEENGYKSVSDYVRTLIADVNDTENEIVKK